MTRAPRMPRRGPARAEPRARTRTPPRPRSPARRARPKSGSRPRPRPQTHTTARPPRPEAAAGRAGRRGPARAGLCARALGPLVPRGEVLGLLVGELVDCDAHGLEIEPRDLVVDLLRHRVDLL